jgi:hypothetical protein
MVQVAKRNSARCPTYPGSLRSLTVAGLRVADQANHDDRARGRTSRAIASPLCIRAFVRSCMACRFIQNSGLVP